MKISQYHRHVRVPEFVIDLKGPAYYEDDLQRKMLQETLLHAKAARDHLLTSTAIAVHSLPQLSSGGLTNQLLHKERWSYNLHTSANRGAAIDHSNLMPHIPLVSTCGDDSSSIDNSQKISATLQQSVQQSHNAPSTYHPHSHHHHGRSGGRHGSTTAAAAASAAADDEQRQAYARRAMMMNSSTSPTPAGTAAAAGTACPPGLLSGMYHPAFFSGFSFPGGYPYPMGAAGAAQSPWVPSMQAAAAAAGYPGSSDMYSAFAAAAASTGGYSPGTLE